MTQSSSSAPASDARIDRGRQLAGADSHGPFPATVEIRTIGQLLGVALMSVRRVQLLGIPPGDASAAWQGCFPGAAIASGQDTGPFDVIVDVTVDITTSHSIPPCPAESAGLPEDIRSSLDHLVAGGALLLDARRAVGLVSRLTRSDGRLIDEVSSFRIHGAYGLIQKAGGHTLLRSDGAEATVRTASDPLAAARADLAEMRSALDRSEELIAIERSGRLEVQSHLNTILDSTTWKLFAPVRRSVALLQAARRVASASRAFVQARGGVGGALHEVGRRYRQGGLRALGQSIAWHGNATVLGAKDYTARYREWIQRQDAIDAGLLQTLPESLDDWPLISIVMPTYNTPDEFLRRVVDSVIAQSYVKWEFCIADDASSNPSVRQILREYAERDQRIRVVERTANGHISEATNSAIDIARGEFIALLDHDDELHRSAMLHVARSIRERPDAAIIYSDEDKIDTDGRRSSPLFKGDFNYELMLGQNAISHLGVYRTSLVREIGGLRKGLEGSQDWDLALRCIEKIRFDQIVHIPLILYHWRMHPESTAAQSSAKPYAIVAAEKAIKDHLDRVGRKATVRQNPMLMDMIRVDFAVPEPAPSVEIVIPTRDNASLLLTCLTSLFEKTSYPRFSVCIVDNGSVDQDALDLLKRYAARPDVRILRDERLFNFSALNNQAVSGSSADLICLMNNDIEIVSSDWLDEMVAQATRPGVGCVGAALWYPDGTLQHGGITLGIAGAAGHAHRHFPRSSHGYFGWLSLRRAVSAVTAACLVVSRRIYDDVGGLDEMLAVAYNDVDFCLKVSQAGYRNVWTPFVDIIHHESVSRGSDVGGSKARRLDGERARLVQRWGSLLFSDPYYSPNLTLNAENYEIASIQELEALNRRAGSRAAESAVQDVR